MIKRETKQMSSASKWEIPLEQGQSHGRALASHSVKFLMSGIVNI